MNPAPRKQFRPRAVVFTWDGDVMIPLPRFRDLCNKQFVVHEEYPLSIVENRSLASHNHYFAALNEGWQNLNEQDAKRFPTPETLRAWCLVECGYCTDTRYVMDTPKDAKSMGLLLRKLSPLAVITIKGNIVVHYEAESQSAAAMKKERFEASKAEVLALVASMSRTTVAELKKNAGRSA